ncbi:porin family protein [Novosphingobium sp. YJ-S2-02]|uniref:Porin family protein n=1 Tax=Novosphingobium aureum TaxID=2792964 RepID=A0A931MJU7_9SPHN|nr:outer membrane beta-barrel protein [Novosphingobium aureum]MBH0112088.1 porin family protein [Novosphingobium aureum]
MMQYNIVFCAICAAAFLPSAPAMAATEEGFYGHVRFGLHLPQDPKTTIETDLYDTDTVFYGDDYINGKLNRDSSIEIAGGLGYDIGMIRGEITASYTKSDIKTGTFTARNGAPLTNDEILTACTYIADCTSTDNGFKAAFEDTSIRTFAAMASAWLDIETSLPVEPYVGGGIGFASNRLHYYDGKDSKTTFRWELGAGIAGAISPGIMATLDYRFSGSDGWKYYQDPGYEDASVDIGSLKAHTIAIGLRTYF